MKKLFFVLIVIFAFFVGATSCSKDKQTLVNTNWEVESVKVHSDSTWQYPEPIGLWKDEFILKITSKSQYVFGPCSGDVRFLANKKIKFENGNCFLPGGYPDLVWECNYMLNRITHYELLENKFTLKGDNGEIINLKKIE
ncbi:MAG: hypothetical protein FWC34_08710 [Bacteroidetes bacterium]|nr:hypothetical protein [Bacteroidota bacterium]MCL2302356.1 hypothetical protein [Lentimicrobiaceae bacterium]